MYINFELFSAESNMPSWLPGRENKWPMNEPSSFSRVSTPLSQKKIHQETKIAPCNLHGTSRPQKGIQEME